jgi:hypothetical protein
MVNIPEFRGGPAAQILMVWRLARFGHRRADFHNSSQCSVGYDALSQKAVQAPALLMGETVSR